MYTHKKLAATIFSVLCSSVICASGNSIALAADGFPTGMGTTTITKDTTYTIMNSVKGTLTGKNGTENITLENGENGNNHNGVLLVEGSSSVNINNLASLTVLNADDNSKNNKDGIAVWANQNLTISNVGTVNIGTADQPLPYNTSNRYIPVAIHSAQGHITFTDIENLNIHTHGQGIMAQKTNKDNIIPSVKIQADTVTINTGDTSIMAATLNNNIGIAAVSIKANNIVTIHSNGYDAVESWDGVGGGTTNIDISGNNGVAIQSDVANRYGIFMTALSSSESSLNINSENGDILIQGDAGAVYMRENNGANTNRIITGNITGKNVTLRTAGTAANVQNGDLTLATTGDGVITLDSSSGQAASISGTNGNLTLGDGKNTTVVSNGTITVANNAALNVSKNTTLVVDASKLGKNAFITATDGGTINADKTSKLYVENAAANTQLFSIEDGRINGFTSTNTVFDNTFLKLNADGTITVLSADEATAQLGNYAARDIAIAATNANDTALTTLLKDKENAWNSAVMIGTLGGAAHSTYTMSDLFANGIFQHETTQDEGIWAQYLHSKETVDGMNAEGVSASYDAQYNGVIVGADLYHKNNTAAGLAFVYADGNADGTNGTAATKNDADYYGVSLYGNTKKGNTRILADISYVSGNHDMTQYIGTQTITAKPDTEAWSVGVKGVKEYQIGKTGLLMPYIGARYLRLTTDQYSSSLGLHYDAEDQNMFILPVGIDYSATWETGAWKFHPYIGAGYVWTMGDRSGDQTVSWGNTADTIAFDTADAGSFLAKAGVSADCGDISIGLGYAYQKGDTTKNNVWVGNISYKF